MSAKTRYQNSEAFLERALKTIPLGSQTFSKSKTQFPHGVSPYFAQRAKGSKLWDIDGNEYIDFINSLCSITLGYSDSDVNAAVTQQLEDGVIFSLPHPIETYVSEMLTEVIPCAEMTRFGKNGSDATSGAIRLARAYTKRDRVVACGYHGWQDWYIGATARNLGVPQATRGLTTLFSYNDLESLENQFKQYPGEIAAVILEPMNVYAPKPGFLEGVKEITHRHGALLIFDETITGFRYSIGGAQKLFGVTPDLATFGKGIANGYPISALCGSAKVMNLMEEIFFSSTFGGETLSLAAAQATITKLKTKPVIESLNIQGTKVIDGLNELIRKNGLEETLSVAGHPSWIFFMMKDAPGVASWDLKTLFMQEMMARGLLSFGTFNMSYAHSDADVAYLLKSLGEVLPIMTDAIKSESITKFLRCEPLKPLFKVR